MKWLVQRFSDGTTFAFRKVMEIDQKQKAIFTPSVFHSSLKDSPAQKPLNLLSFSTSGHSTRSINPNQRAVIAQAERIINTHEISTANFFLLVFFRPAAVTFVRA